MKYLLAVFLLGISATVVAANGVKSGKVEYIRVHDGAVHADWKEPIFWFTLEGVTAADGCGTWNGRVLFVMDSEQAYSLILAAHIAGKEIGVRYDDAIRAPAANYCKATYITSGVPVL